MMAAQLAVKCDNHDLEDCPASVMGYWRAALEYGLRIHDGGTAMILVDYCPWCRARLRPDSRGAFVRAGWLTEEAVPLETPRTRVPGLRPVPGRRVEPCAERSGWPLRRSRVPQAGRRGTHSRGQRYAF